MENEYSIDIKTIRGISGTVAEYLVTSELLKRNYLASMTIKNMPGVDIIVTDENTDRMFGIQVKSRIDMTKVRSWTLHEKDEKRTSSHLFYIFVNLPAKKLPQPEFYIFPSREVADRITKYNIEWLKEDPNHKPNTMRTFKLKLDELKNCLNNWEKLALWTKK